MLSLLSLLLGFDIVHMFVGIFATLFVNYLFMHSRTAVTFAFVFNMVCLQINFNRYKLKGIFNYRLSYM